MLQYCFSNTIPKTSNPNGTDSLSRISTIEDDYNKMEADCG